MHKTRHYDTHNTFQQAQNQTLQDAQHILTHTKPRYYKKFFKLKNNLAPPWLKSCPPHPQQLHNV